MWITIIKGYVLKIFNDKEEYSDKPFYFKYHFNWNKIKSTEIFPNY